MPTPLLAFLCIDVGTRQNLHSNVLIVLGRAQLSASSMRLLVYLIQDVEVSSFQYNSTCEKCENMFGTNKTADQG